MLRQLVLFTVVGTLGFLADVAVLYAVQGRLGPFLGRVLSFCVAVIVTWVLNRTLTFRGSHSGLSRSGEFFTYFLLMVVGGAVNVGAYSALVLGSQMVREHLVIGVAAGSLAGMLVNFTTSRYLLFRRRS